MKDSNINLLQLAAIAVGIKIDKSKTNGGGHHNTGVDSNGDAVIDWHNGITWNPCRKPKDAFQLMMLLKISVVFDDGKVIATTNFPNEIKIELLNPFNDPAIVYRAIVLVASKIGSLMKQ